jgi:predicted permease
MRVLNRFLARLGNFATSSRVDARLHEELEQHLALQIDENIRAGMSPDEACRKARMKLGSLDVIREAYRSEEGLPLVECILQDCRFAFRQMRKAPGFMAVAVLTLTLGIGATTAIFTFVYSTIFKSLPYPEADRIIRVYDSRAKGESTGGLVGALRFFDVKERSRSLESAGFYYFDRTIITADSKLPESVNGTGVNAGFWKVFGVQPLLGRTFAEGEDKWNSPQVVVLSYSAWQKMFAGDPGVIGKQVSLDQAAATIIGIMPQSFEVPAKIELWHPSHIDKAKWGSYRGEGTRFLNVVARLGPGVTLPQARSDLVGIAKQLQRQYPETDASWRFTCESLRDSYFGTLRPAMLALIAAAFLLLLIACINIANLLLSRASARESEVALRRALGASPARIAMQFLTESILLALVGGVAGVLAALALVREVATQMPGRLGVPGTVEMNWPVLAFALAISVATGIAFGLAPALQSRTTPLNTVLKRGETRLGGSAGNALRGLLTAVQVGLSLVLVVGALMLGQSVWNLLKSPLGFQPDHLLVFSWKLPWNTKSELVNNFYAEVQRRITALPGVSAAGQVDSPPAVDWHLRSNFDADWLPQIANQPAINAEDRHTAGDFLEAMGARLLAGRMFNEQDQRSKTPPVLVNEALAREYMPGGNPLGHHLIVGGNAHEIVGVIANQRGIAGALEKPPGPVVYWPADADGVTNRYFVVHSAIPPQQLFHEIRDQLYQVDPRQAAGPMETMDDLLDKAVAQPRLNMLVLVSFAAIALLLACVGIYGVVSYFATQRTQEIGIRMALGATRTQIAGLFIYRVMSWALGGLLAGTVVSFGVMHLLRNQLYAVQPSDPRVFVASILILLIPVLVAALRPAMRAANMDPMWALRAE